ncbi:peptide chain release factor N(5)-glutamine methyltransferase [Patescibacteria group bacterium]|nr:peptide chain release factor N(5)-glutamine methyltransferase [Patescibacteria group bacterium]
MPTLADYFNLNKNFSREINILLAFVCKKELTWLLSHPEYKLQDQEESKFTKYYKLLQSGVPLAYIIGQQSFYNYNFKVSRAVLIPRPETELIVDIAKDYLLKNQGKTACLDIGTGSGAIIISLAAEIKKLSTEIFKTSKFLAGDISTKALKIAQDNAKAHNLEDKIEFIEGNLLEPFISTLAKKHFKSLFIAANLPYLSPSERQQEKSITMEPDLALLGGEDGLDLYIELLQSLHNNRQLIPFHLIMEINPWQSELLIQSVNNNFPEVQIKKTSDLSGQTRFIEVIKK